MAISGIAVVAPTVAAAQGGPFGIGTPEPAGAAWAGPFAPLFAQIAAWQSEFYRQLTETLSTLKENGSAFWVLAGVSFLYGIFHAAGPGHGKAVISAYVLASNETLKRGVLISCAAAFVQAITAIALVGALSGILNVTAVEMTETTNLLELVSYGLIALIGGWLLWTRLRGRGHHHHAHASANHAPLPATAGITPEIHRADIASGEAEDHHEHDRHHKHGGHHHHDGHSHAPDPAMLSRPLTLSSAWAAIMAVGIRPCSGAVIVLVFALAQGLFVAGIGSTFIMAIGTAITVSLLASLAVLARDVALRVTGGGRRFAVVLRSIEVVAAAAVLALGLLLLGGALSA